MSALKKIVTSTFAVLAISTAAMGVAWADGDVKGGKDNPYVGRYAGSRLNHYLERGYDEYSLVQAKPSWDFEKENESNRVNFIKFNSNAFIKLKGKSTTYGYDIAKKGVTSYEVNANTIAYMESKGVNILYTCSDEECTSEHRMNYTHWSFEDGYHGGLVNWGIGAKHIRYIFGKVSDAANDRYLAVMTAEGTDGEVDSTVEMVEVKGMDTNKMVLVDASAMEKSMNATGKVTLYGIQFDFDKATIKPESKPTLDEIAKYLKKNADQKIAIVGYTDNKGGFAYNQDLSKRRADAVAAALASQYGIPADHMDASGAGMGSPVASNATEEGQAKNRRVELIKE